MSAANYTDIFTKPIFKNQTGNWWSDVNYVDSLDIIRENFLKARESFVAIGYYLKHIKEKELYLEGGYSDIWQCAQAEFGLSQTAAFNYMKMNDAYSVDGDTPILDKKYAGFNKSQLQEMLTLTAEKRKEVTPEQTVSQIRETVREEKKGKEPSEQAVREFYGQYVKDMDHEPRSTLKERLKQKYRNAGGMMDGNIQWEGSARGIRISTLKERLKQKYKDTGGADEITWAHLVKLIERYFPYVPQEPVCVQPMGSPQAKTAEEGKTQIPGQMQIGDYPEVLPDNPIKTGNGDIQEPDEKKNLERSRYIQETDLKKCITGWDRYGDCLCRLLEHSERENDEDATEALRWAIASLKKL